MKRIIQALVLTLLLVAVVAGGYWYYGNHNASSTAAATTASLTQVVTAQRGNLSANISVVGALDAVDSADLAFERMSNTAKLQSLAVKAGNTVKTGQVLATIDPTPYQQALDQAKSDLQAAEVKLADLKTPVTALDIAKADLAIATAQYQRQEAQDALVNLEQPDIAQLKANVADAQSALAQAQASVVAARSDTAALDQLTKLRDTESELTVEHGRLANETYSDAFYQDRRQVAYNKMMDAVDARVTAEVQPQVDSLKAQIQVRTAQRSLADAQKALADAQAGAKASTDAALGLGSALCW
jgi:multidrug efflux pump subunit AcrA (membrane-fusion protein)